MKSIIDYINEGRSVTITFQYVVGLILRDFLYGAHNEDFYNFGTKEDKENLSAVLSKVNTKVEKAEQTHSNRISLSLKDYEGLMLRDFLRTSKEDDWYEFGTKEDKENLNTAYTKLNGQIV